MNRRGGRRGRGRGRWTGINAGPRFAGMYQMGFGKSIFQHITCIKCLCILKYINAILFFGIWTG